MEFLLWIGIVCMALIPVAVITAAALYALYWYYEAKYYDD